MLDELTVRKRAWMLGILAFLVFVAWWPEFGRAKLGPTVCPTELLCVVFLDVGQGDAVFVQSPNGQQLLLDGGPDSAVLGELGSVMDFGDRDLDYILLTHPDKDHIGGLVSVLDRYQVDNVIRTENESDTNVWQDLEEAVETEQATVYLAERGQRYDLGQGVYLEVLFPNINTTDLESNTASIVARLVYGDTSFMLTGDAPQAIEEYLVSLHDDLTSAVLKVGHHGSRTSTATEFVAAVQPTYAVISADKDNSYGHPHQEVLATLRQSGAVVLSTAEHGSVVFVSNGTVVEPL